MKNMLFILILLVLVLLPLSASKNRLALFDLTVQTENPSYEHIGKGFSKLISEDLNVSQGITVIDRRKCLDFLEERSMTIEDLDDPNMTDLVSEILKVDYYIQGEIQSTGSNVIINLWMIECSTGEVVWKEELTENLSDYEFISATFARLILIHLHSDIPRVITDKAKSRISKDEDEFITLSTVVYYLDKKDREGAKEAMARGESETNDTLLKNMEWSVETVSPKVRVETELHTSTYNPASLGFINRDQVYFWKNASFRSSEEADNDQNENGYSIISIDGYSVNDHYRPLKFGYMTPIGQKLGLGIEYIGGGFERWLGTPGTFFDSQGSPVNLLRNLTGNSGVNVSAGYRFREDMSFGASLLIWSIHERDDQFGNIIYMVDDGTYFSIQGGFMLKALEDRLTFDFSAVYTNQTEQYVDFSTLEVIEGALPFLVQASVVSDLIERRLFLSLTGISDIYIDNRGGYVFRIIPVVEFWLSPSFALRAGCEYSQMGQFGELSTGSGVLAGISFKFNKLEINANFTTRTKPIRFLPGQSYPVSTLLIGATFTPNFITR